MKKIITLLALAFCLNAGAQCTLTVTPQFTSICAGSSDVLTASGTTSYTWTPTATLNNPNIANPTASPTTTTIYTVTGTTGTCVATPVTVTVSVNAVPSAPVYSGSNPVMLCQGTATTLSVTSSGGTTPEWYSGTSFRAAGTNYAPPTLTVGTTVYNVIDSTLTPGGCNSSPLTITVTVNSMPSPPVLAAPTAVNNISCADSPPTLTVNSGTSIAEWYSGNTLLYIGSSYTPPASLPPGTYTYSVIDSSATPSGCISAPPSANTVTLSVTVNPLPIMSAVSYPGCIGQTPGYAVIYGANIINCFTCDGVTINGGDTLVGNISAASGYTIGTTDANGCFNFFSGAIVENPLPIITVSNPSICAGAIYTITASGANTYTWNTGLVDATIISSPTITTNYIVTGTDGNGCTNRDSVIVTPSPTVTYTLVADTAPHTWDAYPNYSGGVGAYTYIWNWGDGTPLSSTAYPSHVYASPGSYSICVTITDANGCASTYCQYDAVSRLGNNSPLSNMVYINVKSGTMGIKQFTTNKEQVNIYPNPNNGSFVIESQNTLYNVHCTVYDVNGKMVLSQTINGKTSIDASSLNEGVYNINLQSNEGVVNKRVVIVR